MENLLASCGKALARKLLCLPRMRTALARDSRLDHYVAEAKRYPVLTRDEELGLARRFHDCHDPVDAKRLALANLRFVLKVAHEFRGYGLDLSDLVQEGNIGLLTGIAKFDPERGYRLISYAVWWIRAFIWNHVMRNASMVRMPASSVQRKLFFKLRGTRRALEQRTGGEVSSEALAKELNLDVSQIEEANTRLAIHDLSLDADFHGKVLPPPAALRSGATQEDLLGDEEARALKHEWIEQVMRPLDDRERTAIHARYLQDEPVTLAKLGERFHVSRERVRQIEARAFSKMRVRLEAGPKELQEAV